MPGGSRKTHEFPQGKPLLLTFIDGAFAGLGALTFAISVVVFGLESWRSFVPVMAILTAYTVTHSLLLIRYERTGDAVPIHRVSVAVKFPQGFPKPMLAARLAFFVVVAFMLLFGIGPFPFDVMRYGIIGCVFGLIGIAAINLLLEAHYVRAGRAAEVQYIRNRHT